MTLHVWILFLLCLRSKCRCWLRYDGRLAKFGIQYIYQNEKDLQKLREEIYNKMREGRLSITEGLRMHAVGQMLGRIIPTNRAPIAKYYFSADITA